MTYDDLLENFACLTDWEDKYRYLIELGDAHIVRGLAAILLILVNGKTTAQIQSLDLAEAFQKLGLLEHLSPTRRSGFTALVQHIQKLTRESP